MEVQAVRGHPLASVGVLLSPRWVDDSQAGVLRAGGVEEVDQGVAPPGLVGGLLLTAEIVQVWSCGKSASQRQSAGVDPSTTRTCLCYSSSWRLTKKATST